MVIRALLLDKDGPIVPLEPTWNRWADIVITDLDSLLPHQLAARVLNVDPANGRIDPDGLIATGTMSAIKMALIDTIASHTGHTRTIIEPKVSAAIRHADQQLASTPLNATDGIHTVVAACKEQAIGVAVVTNDHRSSALAQLDAVGLLPLVDVIVCGDDGHAPKPDPAMLAFALNALDVRATDAVMVGDTAVDYLAASACGTEFVLLRPTRPSWLPASVRHVTDTNGIGAIYL